MRTYLNWTKNSWGTQLYTIMLISPLSFTLSGRYGDGSAVAVLTNGLYWPSRIISNQDSYYLGFRLDLIGPNGTDGRRRYGMSLRCLAR